MKFHAVLRIIFEAESGVEAELFAAQAQQAVEGELDMDSGDEVSVTYIGPEVTGTTPSELIGILTRSRNELILTKSRPCWDAAKEIDKIIWHLERHDHAFARSYDYGHFFEIAEEVLNSMDEMEIENDQ